MLGDLEHFSMIPEKVSWGGGSPEAGKPPRTEQWPIKVTSLVMVYLRMPQL